MPLAGVIFDLDGVLVDTVPAHYSAWRRMFLDEGYAFDQDIYHQKVDGRPRFDGARAVMVDATPERVAAACARKNEYFREAIERGEFNVFSTSVAFVEECQRAGLKLAAASSSENVRLILDKVGLLDRFDAVVGGRDVAVGKPDPSIFFAAADRMRLPADECVVVEDAVSGVAAAKSGGFYCVGVVRSADRSRLGAADLIVSDLGELDLARLADALNAGPEDSDPGRSRREQAR
jgi:beta-phosphoglucomutase